MLGLIIGLVVAVGVGTTAIVADNARPGNALFGLDQAMENARLSIVAEEKKDELRIKFTEERIKELKDISDDDSDDDSDDSDDESDDSSDDSDESENDTADDSDSKELSDDQKERITAGIASALTLMSQVDPASIDPARLEALIAQLNGYLTTFPEESRIQFNDERFKIKIETEDDDQGKDEGEHDNRVIKTETRTDEGRIRVEIKDGSIEIKTKLDDKNDDDDGDESDDEHDGLGDIEVKIYSDKTVVEVEYNDQKTTFVTSSTTREAIVADILAKFPTLTEAEINAVIEIETEDDENDDSNDDSDESDDDSDDSDDESDNDNSGSDDDNESDDDSNSGRD